MAAKKTTSASNKKITNDKKPNIIPLIKSRRVLTFEARKKNIRRISLGASVLITTALEYVLSEICELSTEAARQERGRKKSDTQRVLVSFSDVSLAVRSDNELNTLFSCVRIMDSDPLKKTDKDLAQLFTYACA